MKISKKQLIVAVLLSLVLVATMAAAVQAKSVYVLVHCNSSTSPISAYDIQGDKIVFQKTVNSNLGWGSAGMAIDTDSKTVFMTRESSGTIVKVDAETLTVIGTQVCPGASNLAGIVVDQDKGLVYAVQRTYSGSPTTLYVYDLNFNPVQQVPISTGGVGLALDETKDLLYVTNFTQTVRYFDTATWTQQGSFNVSHTSYYGAAGIAVDASSGYVYTGAWYGDNILSKYDLNTNTETTLDIGRGVVGLAVDPSTGLLYMTSFWDDLRVYDCSTTPFTMTDQTGDLGDPAGICIPGKDISYNPLGLSKDDGLDDNTECVSPGSNITYTISYDSTQNTVDVTNATITDTLPADTTFVSATGTFSIAGNTITWDLGTITAGSTGSVELVVQVGSGVSPGSVIHNDATIDSDQTPPTTQGDDTNICTNQPPVADAGGPYTSTENFPIDFNGCGSTDPDGDSLQFRWDFDSDGTWDTGWMDTCIATNMWCDDFTGTATLEVSDGQATATDTAAVTVMNLAPIIDVLSYAPIDVQCANEPITFTGIGKDPGCDSVTVVWDYGDGNSYVDVGQTGPPFNSVVTHTYGAFGTYKVTLTVTDDDGAITKDKLTVVVKDTTPPEVTGGCVESVNPHGNNIPGKNRGKNGKPKGVNPDGFYELAFEVTDNCDPNPQLFVGTIDNLLMFAVEPGIVVKFTESDDAEPVMKKIGSNNGQADAVTWHIILPGDPVISAVDASGNIVTCCECLVPPPPK